MLNYLSTGPKNSNEYLFEKYLKNETISVSSAGIEHPDAFGKEEKRKNKMYRRFIKDGIKISAKELVDALGGIDYFKKNFKSTKEAIEYVKKRSIEIQKVLKIRSNEIPWDDIEHLFKNSIKR